MLRALRRQVRPDESALVRDALLLLFGFTSGHLLLETARDALFLARLPASRLPWVYLLIAIGALYLFQRSPAPRHPGDARRGLQRTLQLAAAVTLLFWVALPFAGTVAYYALYVWTGVLATLFVVRFWTAAAATFDVGQAKRVYAVIGAGAVAGGILGAGLASVLASLLPARYLVAAAGLVFGLTSLLPPPPEDDSEPASETDLAAAPTQLGAVRAVLSHPFLLRASAVLFLAAITFTLVDYVFKSTVDRYVAPARLDTFFAVTYLGLNCLSLVVQLGLAGWIVRRLGVNRGMAIVPALILAASLGVAAGGGLVAAVLLKTVDGGFRNSLHRTGAELLFVPLNPQLRLRVKSVVDVVGQRGGQAVASVLILGLLSLSSSGAVFAALVAVATTAWLMLSLGLRQHYLDVFRASLSEEIAAVRWELPELDVAGLEALVAACGSDDERRVVAALELLAAYGRARLIPPSLLRSDSPTVALRVLEIFADTGRSDGIEWIRPLTAHGDPTIREAASRAVAALTGPPAAADHSASADEAALRSQVTELANRRRRREVKASLASGGSAALDVLDECLADTALPHDVRRQIPEVVGAIGTAPAASVLVDRLTRESDGMVRFKILRALGRMRRRQPQLPLDLRTLVRERGRALDTAARLMSMRRSLGRSTRGDASARDLLLNLLRDKQTHALERAFRIYNLESGNEDFFRVFRGLQSPAREKREGARELLIHLLPSEEVDRLLELIDDLADPAPDGEAVAPSDGPLDLHAVIEALSDMQSASIRELTAAYGASLQFGSPAS